MRIFYTDQPSQIQSPKGKKAQLKQIVKIIIIFYHKSVVVQAEKHDIDERSLMSVDYFINMGILA